MKNYAIFEINTEEEEISLLSESYFSNEEIGEITAVILDRYKEIMPDICLNRTSSNVATELSKKIIEFAKAIEKIDNLRDLNNNTITTIKLPLTDTDIIVIQEIAT